MFSNIGLFFMQVLFFLFLGIIKHNSPNIITDSEFESVVANWLRHANTRLSRSKQL